MIICHCNVILRQEIESAVCRILADDPAGRLEPQFVYRELERRGRCCGCFPTVERIVDEVLTSALSGVDETTFSITSPEPDLIPRDA
ncbi:MAG: hypothetical protein ROR55_19235 [Devosia sp.]